MQKTAVILAVGLTPDLIGEHSPNLNKLVKSGGQRPLETITPAVTCSVQATLMTGLLPKDHGCVANGWYFRDLSEVLYWRQPESLVAGEKIWDAAKKLDPNFTCAKMFWWYNMYSSADYAVTPRPMYPADGRKLPDIWSAPSDLRDELQQKFGTFPLFNFWGPTADIKSSQWIADSSIYVYEKYDPTLSLIYLPHLDYNLQRLGPDHPDIKKDVAKLDQVCGQLIDRFEKDDTRIIVVSEYGITKVNSAVDLNRALRQQNLIGFRQELGREVFDPGASEAFAAVDHQIANIYVKNPARIQEVKSLVGNLDGVEMVLDDQGKKQFGLDHPNSGQLVAISQPDKWFTYYYWLDDDKAPDFARCVDIHRKPGYDPVELFLDPKLKLPKLKVASKLAKKILGFRYLMDVIGLDASVVKGSHGRLIEDKNKGPLLISNRPELLPQGPISATEFKNLVLSHLIEK